MNYESLAPPPTEPAPTGAGWVAVSSDGAWFWDGETWRRPRTPPWLRSHGLRGVGPQLVVRAFLFLLALPLVVAGTLAAQIVGRALAAVARVVVGVFAFGVVVALLIVLAEALFHP